MKNLKKVLALVVVFAMMFTVAVSASPFKDVADDESYAEAVTVLNALSLMIGDDQGNFNPDQTITRAEAATVVVRAKGLGDAAAGAAGATQFSDVPADHWASGFINIATQSGIVAGYGNGKFGPSDPVTYEQMVKLIVAALGYTPKAEANGGYPTGYLVIASQKGITKGATGNAGDPAPRKTVARLAYNALDVGLMVQTGFVKGQEEYEEGDDTLLTDLGIDKYEGVITETYASKDGAVKSDDEYIKVRYYTLNGVSYGSARDIETFDVGETDAADFLGYYVTAYVEEDDNTGDLTVLAIAPKSGKNEVVTLDYSQVDKITKDNAGDLSKLEYVENESDKNTIKLDISDNAALYFNGRLDKTGLVIEYLEEIVDDGIYPGKVTLLSNGIDGDNYNYIFVTKYTKDVVVGDVNAAKQIAYDKDDNDVGIDLDDDSVVYYFYDEDGNMASFEDIKEDSVLTFAESDDGFLVSVFIKNDSKIDGSVTEITSDKDAYYRIDGNYYRLGYDPETEDTYVGKISVGDEGVYFLNVDNRIVDKDTNTKNTNTKYAYIINAYLDDGLNGNKLEVKYITADGKWETSYLATNITFYGPNAKTSSTISKVADNGIAGLVTVNAGNAQLVAPTLVKYTKNSSGDINRIYLAGKNSDYFTQDVEEESATYKAATKKLTNKLYVEDDTLVFSIKTTGDTTDEDNYKVTTAKALFSDDQDYNVVAYDMDGLYADVLVVKDAEGILDSATRLFVLTSVASGRNSDDDEVLKFYGYQEGQSVTAESTADGIVYYDINGEEIDDPGLGAGDVIIFSLDGAGAIDKIQVLFEAEDAIDANAFYINNDKLDDDDYVENYFGTAIKKQTGSKLTLDLAGTAKAEDNIVTMKGDYEVYEVNVERKTPVVAKSSYGAIDAATPKNGKSIDRVYIRMYDEDIVDVVVFTYTYSEDE